MSGAGLRENSWRLPLAFAVTACFIDRVTMTNTNEITVGTSVRRIDTRFPSMNDGAGVIIAIEDDRIQIQWESDIAGKPRKGWMQRKAQNKRWRIA